MTLETTLALAGFAIATSITPGPNNLMLMASGANFGLKRSVPHMLGISLGHGFMIVLIGLGLIQVFEAYPLLHQIMQVLSVAYLLFLAWKITRAAAPEGRDSEGRPFTFLQAAGFQWVNPKGWFMALTAITVYAPSESLAAILSVAVVFSLVNLPSILIWTCLGQGVRRFLTSPGRLRAFNWTMAALLVASLALIFKPVSG
ncbi:MAG: LysE family translocator [Silicimonas sp.]|nr:LysE family translocator [Silicimonas sp.]